MTPPCLVLCPVHPSGYASDETSLQSNYRPVEIDRKVVTDYCQGNGPDFMSRPVSSALLAKLRSQVAKPFRGEEPRPDREGIVKPCSCDAK